MMATGSATTAPSIIFFLLATLTTNVAQAFFSLQKQPSPARFHSPASAVVDLQQRCCHATATPAMKTTTTTTTTTRLQMSLKPAAIPLMDSGKALARSGEVLIDLTQTMDLYGGGLSSAGAEIRNAGDSVAQAAASARFKTGLELVIDELRESGTCLQAAAQKLERAVQEAQQDEQMELAQTIDSMIAPMASCGELLEEAGATVMRREAPSATGERLAQAGDLLSQVSNTIPNLLKEDKDGILSSQRLAYAAEKMTEAGNSLQGLTKKPTGKSWLKGGGL